MKSLRIVVWLATLLPILAAGLWATHAGRFPEPWSQRRALGEMSTQWTFAEWANVQQEPWHPIVRCLHLAALHIPGATIRWAAFANVLLAALLVCCVGALLRRSFALAGLAGACSLLAVGVLACSPAFGSDWLHGERLGVFLPPLLLAKSLLLLHADGRFAWRGAAAIGLASLAPLCHGNGIVVPIALLPGLAEAARRTGSGRSTAWMIAGVLLGTVTAAISMWRAGVLGLAETSLWAAVLDAPAACLRALLRTTGADWLDALPGTRFDETLLGAASWLLPLVLWRVGDRSESARRAAAPWWCCVWFGLLVVLWITARHGLDLDAATHRELTFGAFLLPVGTLGLCAARLGRALLPLGGGALLVLALQDWHRGIETLRLARMQVEGTEAVLLVSPAIVGPPSVHAWPVPDPAQLGVLEARGWVPRRDEGFGQRILTAADAPTTRQHGACNGGDARRVHGLVRSSLSGDTAQWVVIVATSADAPWRQVGLVRPDFAGVGRNVPWTVVLDEPLSEGTRVRALGMLVRPAAVVTLGPTFVVRQNVLTDEPDS